MVPAAAVVAGPGSGIALAARIGGAREHEGAQYPGRALEAVVGGARVLHAVDIVNLAWVAVRGAKPGSSIRWTTLSGMVVGESKTEGSFISFQKPSMPYGDEVLDRACPTRRESAGCVKSGKTLGPGQTGPT